jgi:hypothetical protein
MVPGGRSTTNDRAREARSPSYLTALAGLVLVGCCKGSPDCPSEPGDTSGRAYRYKVTREADARRLASGCSSPDYPNATVRAQIGDRLVYDILEEDVLKEDAPGSGNWWCSDEDLIGRRSSALVDHLDCWGMPTHAPIRVEHAEAIPADRNQEPTLPFLMKGKGFRFWLEVLDFGALTLPARTLCSKPSMTILQVEE